MIIKTARRFAREAETSNARIATIDLARICRSLKRSLKWPVTVHEAKASNANIHRIAVIYLTQEVGY